MPHGMCYLWQPGILGLHVVADSLIAMAYASIPFTLLYFTARRRDFGFSWMLICFAIFIVACGASHLMEIVTIWYPVYWLSGAVKAVTAAASITTAILLVRSVPGALRWPSPADLMVANGELKRESEERSRVELELRLTNDSLELRVAARTAELEAANRALTHEIRGRTAQLREREAMLQEIHHRVKNNLQVISSLINMQMRTIADSATRQSLSACRGRVETMSQIHEMLYESKDYARVPFSQYAQDLVQRVMSASGLTNAIAVRFELDQISLPVNQAIPCGLILNELVANSLKHAFPNGDSGEIAVTWRRLETGRVLLGVSDNGIGMVADYQPEDSKSLGVQLVHTLAEQLEAELTIVLRPGVSVRVMFKTDTSA
jgi:two-component sensor histidine kinase